MKNQKPLLSVLIPNYNHAHFLPSALDAMLAQSYRPIEIIICDDGSTDKSLNVIDSYARRFPEIHYLINEKNMGVIPTLNRLIQEAKGAYIHTASADDIILPGFYEQSMSILERYPDAALCQSHPAFLISGTDKGLIYGWEGIDEPCFLTPDEICSIIRKKLVGLTTNAIIFKKQYVIEQGLQDPEFRWFADWFMALCLSFKYGICYNPKPLALWRVSNDSFSGSALWSKNRKVRKEVSSVFTKVLERLEQKDYKTIKKKFIASNIMRAQALRVLSIQRQSGKYREYINKALLWEALIQLLILFCPASVWRLYERVKVKLFGTVPVDETYK